MQYDVVIVGGGPAGLAAALTLGRARKRVLVCDSGPRRNAAAEHMQNFVTRDGTPPNEFRRIARDQLAAYASVEIRDTRIAAIGGASGDFRVDLAGEGVEARRVLLASGMVDEMLPIEGFRELWGHAVFQCPYCHGWEVRDRRWGYLARDADKAAFFATTLRAWTRDVVVFTHGAFEFPDAPRAALEKAGVRVETRAIARLLVNGERLAGVELADESVDPCEILFAHPPQRQVEVVRALGLELDEHGFVRVDPMTRETSVPGVYAAGDLASPLQAAIAAAASGMQAAATINAELTAALAPAGAL